MKNFSYTLAVTLISGTCSVAAMQDEPRQPAVKIPSSLDLWTISRSDDVLAPGQRPRRTVERTHNSFAKTRRKSMSTIAQIPSQSPLATKQILACREKLRMGLTRSTSSISLLGSSDQTELDQVLCIAAHNGYVEAVHALLEAGANPNNKVLVENNALHLAALKNRVAVIGILLRWPGISKRKQTLNERGINTSIPNFERMTARYMAEHYGSHDAAQILAAFEEQLHKPSPTPSEALVEPLDDTAGVRFVLEAAAATDEQDERELEDLIEAQFEGSSLRLKGDKLKKVTTALAAMAVEDPAPAPARGKPATGKPKRHCTIQ